jgi:hypothetical protein
MTLYKIPFITSYNGLVNLVTLEDIYSGFIDIFGIVMQV